MRPSFRPAIFLHWKLWNAGDGDKKASWLAVGSLCIQSTASKMSLSCFWINICECCLLDVLPHPSPPNTRDASISPTSGSLKPEVHAVWSFFIYLTLSTNEDSNSSVPLNSILKALISPVSHLLRWCSKSPLHFKRDSGLVSWLGPSARPLLVQSVAPWLQTPPASMDGKLCCLLITLWMKRQFRGHCNFSNIQKWLFGRQEGYELKELWI